MLDLVRGHIALIDRVVIQLFDQYLEYVVVGGLQLILDPHAYIIQVKGEFAAVTVADVYPVIACRYDGLVAVGDILAGLNIRDQLMVDHPVVDIIPLVVRRILEVQIVGIDAQLQRALAVPRDIAHLVIVVWLALIDEPGGSGRSAVQGGQVIIVPAPLGPYLQVLRLQASGIVRERNAARFDFFIEIEHILGDLYSGAAVVIVVQGVIAVVL